MALTWVLPNFSTVVVLFCCFGCLFVSSSSKCENCIRMKPPLNKEYERWIQTVRLDDWLNDLMCVACNFSPYLCCAISKKASTAKREDQRATKRRSFGSIFLFKDILVQVLFVRAILKSRRKSNPKDILYKFQYWCDCSVPFCWSAHKTSLTAVRIAHRSDTG